MQDFLAQSLFGNTLREYLLACVVFIATLLFLKLFKSVIIKKARELAQKTKTEIDDAIVSFFEKIGWPVYILVALYAALLALRVPPLLYTILKYLFMFVITYYILRGLGQVINFATQIVIQKRQEEAAVEIDTSLIRLMGGFVKAVLWIIALLVLLQNMGIQVTSLVAGLGIGGIAIAFALQNILADIFASFSIYLDKPFETGDFIVIGQDKGTVKHIGIKSTRLKTLQGEELVISNRELTSERIHNYKKMEKRRVTFKFGVTYNTPVEKLKRIPDIVKKIVDKQEHGEVDRVHFKEFGDFALIFEVVYYLDTKDYLTYMDTQQAINLEIKKQFEKLGVSMAYPTQTIYLHKA
ncbi:mechanosensitive ion channel family protein [Candidatus Woesearchaeota archaeon]|nr:mechanosensitive ion channel family protein [Candidatus Woesearchaeota archaeon]RLE41782.1 MAG: mechanosensitive ion channel family protein [Candidatus Woesearchaeota archaeon]